MKFKVGDRFKVKEEYSELQMTGTVTGTSFNSIHQTDEYVVLWDTNRTVPETYSVDECDRMWNYECPVVTIRASHGIDFLVTNITIDTVGPVKIQCNGHHQWVEVGFHFTKEVCKHCDVERGGQ